jgi:hypothetical protein
MLNVQLSEEQLISLIEQLPIEKKKELIEHLQFDAWLESPEALKLKEKREQEIREDKVLTLDQMKEKLKLHGKNI